MCFLQFIERCDILYCDILHCSNVKNQIFFLPDDQNFQYDAVRTVVFPVLEILNNTDESNHDICQIFLLFDSSELEVSQNSAWTHLGHIVSYHICTIFHYFKNLMTPKLIERMLVLSHLTCPSPHIIL